MTYFAAMVAFITEIGILFGFVAPIWKSVKETRVKLEKVAEGNKCQLRGDMLAIYYHNKESRKIRQYEYENFIMLYEAYKALKGNSFIDKIYDEVKKWEIIT